MTERPVEIEVCEADKPICPRCGKVLRRIWVQDGITYAFCDNRRRDGKPGVCGQHSAVLGEDGLVAVTALSKDEFQTLKDHAQVLLEMRRRIRLHFSGFRPSVVSATATST